MILTYTSKAGQGKSSLMIIDAVKEASKGKKVAIISFEMSERKIMSRIEKIVDFYKLETPKEKRSLVVYQGVYGKSYDLIKKVSKLYQEFDIICIDGCDEITNKDTCEPFLKKLFDLSLGKEFWITQYSYLNVGEINSVVETTKSLKNILITPKKHSLRVDDCLTVVDFIDKTIEEIDLQKIFI